MKHFERLAMNGAMEQLIYIILNEYPDTDERYKTAVDIAKTYGIPLDNTKDYDEENT
jgi:hypothetical protein